MRILTSIVACLLILSGLPIVMAAAEEASSTVAVTTNLIGLPSGFFPPRGMDARFVADYGGYSLYQASDADVARLETTNAPYVRLPDPSYLGIESLSAPMSQVDIGQLTSRAGLYVIQFPVPPKQAWLKALEYGGMRRLAYIPNYAYLVVLDREAGQVFAAIPFQPKLFSYDEVLRRDPKLSDDNAVQRVRFVFVKDPRFDDVSQTVLVHDLKPELYWERGTLAFVEGEVDSDTLDAVLSKPSLVWAEPASPREFFDEVSSEILGGDFVPGTPWDGPGSFVNSIGYSGTGIIVSIADTGIDTGNLTTMHPDLKERVAALIDFGENDSSDGVAEDMYGHGTHVAGIVAGTGASNVKDSDGYLYGMGVAPNASLVMERLVNDMSYWMAPPDHVIAEYALEQGASVSSNSWGMGDTSSPYDWIAAEYDAITRDGDFRTPGDQPLLHVFAAANSGPNPYTLSSPATGKNVLTVGASENYRLSFGPDADSPDDLAFFSSRGPVADGRLKPDVVAPGFWVASALSSNVAPGICGGSLGLLHEACSGTSMATPQVAGGAALFQQYYLANYGTLPSPAMTKAALINTARDMTGDGATAAIPNNDEGWGRMDLVSLLAPTRPDEFLIDQTKALQVGQNATYQIPVTSSGSPLRITLAYTDAPAAGFAYPTLVNDLDLIVTDPAGRTYRGNAFSDGWSVESTSGGDRLNNVEGVYLENPIPGVYKVQIVAVNVPEDGVPLTPAFDQDFALFVRAMMGAAPGGSVQWDREFYQTTADALVIVVDSSLNTDPLVQETATAVATSTTEPAGESLTVTEAGTNSSIFTAGISLRPGAPSNDGILQVSDGDVVNVTYASLYDTAIVDASLPVISNIVTSTTTRSATISFTVSEDARGRVNYGTTPTLGNVTESSTYKTSHSVSLDKLEPGTTYYFDVTAIDRAGNSLTDDNGGAHHTFTTLPVPPILLVSDDYGTPDPSFAQALIANGYDFDEVSTTAPLDVLDDYQVVIWNTGSDYDTLTQQEMDAIGAYLDGGGRLFLSSYYLMYMGATSFSRNYLHVAVFSPPMNEVGNVKGITGDPISGDFPNVNLKYMQPLYPFLVMPDSIATATFKEPLGAPVAIKADTGTYRVVFFTFPYESTYAADSWTGTLLMRRIIEWFGLSIAKDLAVTDMKYPSFTRPNTVVLVNATVANFGVSSELNILVNVTIDGATVNSTTIPTLGSRSTTTVNLSWTATNEGAFLLGVEVAPVAGETVLSNNQRSGSIFVTNVRPINVAVVDSLGTQDPTFWDNMRVDWPAYGTTPLAIDTETLAKSDFTYADILSTRADVLDISCGQRDYTMQEIAAIVQYVQTGRGLVGTCTLPMFSSANAQLARLWGISENLPVMEFPAFPVFPVPPSHPLFRNVTVPYTPAYGLSYAPANDRSWDPADLTTGTYAGLSTSINSTAVITNGLNVYLSAMADYVGPGAAPSRDDYQIMYNALTWAGSWTGILVSHTAPPAVEVFAPFYVNATVESSYDMKSVDTWYLPPGAPSYLQVPMNLVSGSLSNGNWSATIPGQTALGTLRVFVNATDVWDRNASSPEGIVNVVDTTRPTIVDLTTGTPVTASQFTFNATVTDNFAVSSAYLEYWYDSGTHTNVSMSLIAGRYEHSVTVQNTTARLYYQMAAVDTVGIWTTTSPVSLAVSDPYSPTAVVNDPYEIDEDRIAMFDGAGSSDNVGIVNYTWTFSDSLTLYGEVVFRLLQDPGRYDVTLTVRDTAGHMAQASTFVLARDITPPVANIVASSSVNEDTPFLVNGSGSLDNVGIVNYTWRLGSVAVAWGSVAVLVLPNPGLVGISLEVRDLAGNNATATVAVTVGDITPPTIVVAGGVGARKTTPSTLLSFDASGTFDNVKVDRIEWDFGDGRNMTGLTASHPYEKAGSYVVTIKAYDTSGNQATAVFQVTVEDTGIVGLVAAAILIAGVVVALSYFIWTRRRPKKEEIEPQEEQKEEQKEEEEKPPEA